MFGELAKNDVFSVYYKKLLKRLHQNEPVLSMSESLSKTKLNMQNVNGF